MRDLMERFTSFPFSAGCISNSSVDVAGSQPEKSRADAVPTGELALLHSNGKTKTWLFPKPNNISAGIHKVLKGFKNMFQLYKEDDVDEEREMVIGLPTDVQHVAHIGWDGSNSSTGSSTSAIMKSCWDHKGPDLLALPSISLRQFELAMAAQDHGPI